MEVNDVVGKVGAHERAEHGERGHDVHRFHTSIDGEKVTVDKEFPTGEILLGKVGKRSCAYELIAEFNHKESVVVEPGEKFDLRQHGLKGFITVHKEIVMIFINDMDKSYVIERGTHSVADILSKVGESPDGYDLLEEKDGPPLPVPPDKPVQICGCEVFHTQVKSGSSS